MANLREPPFVQIGDAPFEDHLVLEWLVRMWPNITGRFRRLTATLALLRVGLLAGVALVVSGPVALVYKSGHPGDEHLPFVITAIPLLSGFFAGVELAWALLQLRVLRRRAVESES